MIDVNKIKAKGITGILGIEEEGDTIKVKTLYGDEECKKSESAVRALYGMQGQKSCSRR